MSEVEMTKDGNAADTERLGRAMAKVARARPGFIGSAIAIWERANTGRTVAEELRCDEGQIWRLAVTPRPSGPEMPRHAMELATDLGINPTALVNMLRFAQSADAFAGASDDGEMLMAALDADDEEDNRS